MPTLKVLDLFSGMGGFSEAFKQRGHKVTRVDIDPRFEPDICADILNISPSDLRGSGAYDIILASPVCTEFTRDKLPWFNDGPPALDQVIATKELIAALKPQWWILENVQGSVKWIKPILGHHKKRVGSRYLWGDFPIFDCEHIYGKSKVSRSPDRAIIKAIIPYSLSFNLCIACECYKEED